MASTQQFEDPNAQNTDSVLSDSTHSPNIVKEKKESDIPVSHRLDLELKELFAENVVAKIWNVALRLLKEQNNKLTHYPETVPQAGLNSGKFELRDTSFWTCGFFPGSLYLILERTTKYPQHVPTPPCTPQNFLKICRTWMEPLRIMADRQDTHDLGFMIQPSFRMDWELTGSKGSLDVVVLAAENLMRRYDDRVKAVRSWDQQVTKRYSYTNKEEEFLVIVDSMCNLDLLFYAGHHIGNQEMIEIATTHAKTVLKHVVRDDFSTFHLVVFDAKTGAVKEKLTCQGYADQSTWSRGQAWAILGFTQTYIWTKDPVFLHASTALSNYSLSRLDTSPSPFPYVPLWDFDSPVPLPGQEAPLRDTSAGVIAANGMLLLSQILRGQGKDGGKFLDAALRIVKETIELSLDRNSESLSEETGSAARFDAVLGNATANANQDALKRYWDHGLVYADYYFLEFGNKLMRMGLV